MCPGDVLLFNGLGLPECRRGARSFRGSGVGAVSQSPVMRSVWPAPWGASTQDHVIEHFYRALNIAAAEDPSSTSWMPVSSYPTRSRRSMRAAWALSSSIPSSVAISAIRAGVSASMPSRATVMAPWSRAVHKWCTVFQSKRSAIAAITMCS